MKESVFQTAFRKWVESDPGRCTGTFGKCAAFELKVCRGPSISFGAVVPHQTEALLGAERDGTFHKIADLPRQAGTRFQGRRPFDCFMLSGAKAYVGVMLYVRRQRKRDREAVFVRIGEWETARRERGLLGKKSISRYELKRIGITIKPEIDGKRDGGN